jgi:Tol biopolymer transport system component
MLLNKTNVMFIIFIYLLIPSWMASAETLLPKVRETTLANLPEGYQIVPDSIKMSSDLRNVAFAAYTDNTHNIIQVNNRTSRVYYAVKGGFPIWSPDSQKCVYIAYVNKEEAIVVVDGIPIITNIDNADNFIFSLSGTRYACRAQKNNSQFVIVDGNAGTPYDGIPIKDNFTFSPDSKRFIYVALKNKTCVAVVDGREEAQAFNFILGVKFSPDSTHYAYKARTEKNEKGREKWCVVKDGMAGTIYDKIFDLVFRYDSKRLAYAAIKDKKMVMVVDGQESDPHDTVGLPVFSFDSKIFASAYGDKNRYYILLNGERSAAFDQIYKFYFSPDSKRYAFFAQKGDEWFCIVDGEKITGFAKMVETFKFSPDSSRYVYAGVGEDFGQIIVDGKPGQSYSSVGEPYFSPDSKHVVYRAIRPNEQQWITVLNGKESEKKYNGIGQYLFSDDSRHFAFPAILTIERSLMVVDGVEECADKNFKILGDPDFSPDGNYVVYHAREADEKWHLIVNGHVLSETYGGFFKGTPARFDSPTHFHTMGIKPGGTEFVVIDVDIPESYKLTSRIPSL